MTEIYCLLFLQKYTQEYCDIVLFAHKYNKKRIKRPIAKNIINYQGVNKMMDVALMKAVQAKEAG